MKKDYSRLQTLIKQALLACSDKFALEDTKYFLNKALASVSKAQNKQAKRQSAAEDFAKKAKKKNDEWWEMVIESAKKMATEKLEEKTEENNQQ